MSDHDRGAYTPPTDDDLAFDARSPSLKRPIPATLLGSAVVLIVLVGAIVLFYRSGVRGANEAPDAIGKPQMTIKSAPTVSDAKPLPDDGQSMGVYADEKGQGAAAPTKPAFVPAPEQPAPVASTPAASTPAASTPTSAAAPPPAAPPPPVARTQTAQATPSRTAQAATTPPATAPHLRTSEAAPATTAPNPKARPKPKPVEKTKADPVGQLLASDAATPPAKAATANAPVHGVSVQIGAFSSAAIADAEFAKTRAAFAALTAKKPKHVEKATVNGHTYFRTAFTGFTRPQAQAFCEALRAASKACIVR